MPPKKKTTTSTTTKVRKPAVRKPRVTTAPKTVRVTRTRRAPSTRKEHIIDLRDTIPAQATEDIFAHEADYQEPYHESAIFDINEEVEEEAPSRWSLNMYQRIAVTFIILSLVSLGTVLYLTYARLDITIHPKATAVEAKTNFTVYDRPENYEMPGGSVLGLVRSMEVETTATVPATGKKVSGAEVSGTVKIINNYTKDQPLVATTRLLTPDNQLLRLTDGVVVPAGGEIEASVYADTVNPSFTLADTRLTIPGLWAGLQDQIYAEAKAGSVTYKEKVLLSVTQADIDEADRQGKIALLDHARQEIENAYASYDERLYTLEEGTVTVTADSEIGDEKDSLSVTVKGNVTVVAFNKKDVEGILGTALSAAGSADDPFGGNEPIFVLTSADTADNVAQIDSQINTTSIVRSGEEIIEADKLKGLKRNQIEEYINNLPEVDSYELNFRPSFLPWAPYNTKNIVVTVQ